MNRACTAAVVASLAASTACRHVVEIESNPPGALVIEDGEVVGTTPLRLEGTTGQLDARVLEVQHGGAARRFAVEQEGWTEAPILAGLAGGVGAFAGGVALAAGSAFVYGLGLASLFAGAEPQGFALIGAAAGMYVGGVTLATLAPYTPLVAAGMFARKGPDRVRVDLEEGVVTSEPAGMVEPLVGRTPLPQDASAAPPPAAAPE